jgi:hypothetical protein
MNTKRKTLTDVQQIRDASWESMASEGDLSNGDIPNSGTSCMLTTHKMQSVEENSI